MAISTMSARFLPFARLIRPVRLPSCDSEISTPGDSYMFTAWAAQAPAINREIKDGDVIEAGPIRLRAIHTPPHPGRALLLSRRIKKPLQRRHAFQALVGRSDFEGGDAASFLKISRKIIHAAG